MRKLDIVHDFKKTRSCVLSLYNLYDRKGYRLNKIKGSVFNFVRAELNSAVDSFLHSTIGFMGGWQ